LNARRNPAVLALILFLASIAILVALSWANYNYTTQSPGGNDFLVHWMGTRTFLREGISPYSDEAATRIQTFAYGRPARANEHELRVAYPLYSIILFVPFALIEDYALARALWMTVLEVSLLLLAVFCIRLARWKTGLPTLVFFLLFALFWYHGVRPLINGNAVILIALMMVGGLLALRAGGDELAGVLFAFSTIKPQLALLFLVYLTIWGVSQRRWRMIGWMVGTVVLLSASAALLLPDWMIQNLREVIRYPGYNPPGTLGSAIAVWFPAMGQRLGQMIAGVLGGVLLFEWFMQRNAEFRSMLWTACLTLVISQWIGIQTDPGNFIILMPALTVTFALWQERWRRVGVFLVNFSMALLLVGIWLIFLNTVEYGYQPQQSPVMFLPLPAFLLMTLYWVRWWALHPVNVWFDLVYDQENPRPL